LTEEKEKNESLRLKDCQTIMDNTDQNTGAFLEEVMDELEGEVAVVEEEPAW